MSMSLQEQLQHKARDFENESLFHRCSVATNLVMSLEFNPIRCVVTLCHLGQTRSGFAASHFILFSSTVTSNATGNYVVVPERFGQKKEPARRKKKRN